MSAEFQMPGDAERLTSDLGPRTLDPISAMVLAGGRSRRMGRDKAWIEIGGRPLIRRVLDVVATLTDDVMVVGAKGLPACADRRYADLGVRLVADAFPGRGSLGGIYSGLHAARYERCLCVACDMPYLNPHLLRRMVEVSPGYDAVVPCLDPEPPPPGVDTVTARTYRLQPLCAVYARSCLEPIEKVLAEGDLRAIAFLGRVRVRYLSLEEVNRFDPEHRCFLNLNTPAEVEAARRLLGEEGG